MNLNGARQRLQPCETISRGWSISHKVIDIDQRPIGDTALEPRHSYTGAFTPIRGTGFAGLRNPRHAAYKPGAAVSFKRQKADAVSCQGDGVIKIEMHFLPGPLCGM